MVFVETSLRDAYIIDMQRIEDDRGFFARGWCSREFREHGLNGSVTQLNVGYSRRRGTVRGLHFQEGSDAEAKFIRCTRGAIFDVVVDLRPTSTTFKRWIAVELTAENRRMLYVPEGCAQGYQTLEDDTEMYYLTTKTYAPSAARGVRYDDPAFGVEWPLGITEISATDQAWPNFETLRPGRE